MFKEAKRCISVTCLLRTNPMKCLKKWEIRKSGGKMNPLLPAYWALIKTALTVHSFAWVLVSMKHLDTRWRNFPATLCWGVQLKFLAPFQHWLKLANSDGHFSPLDLHVCLCASWANSTKYLSQRKILDKKCLEKSDNVYSRKIFLPFYLVRDFIMLDSILKCHCKFRCTPACHINLRN